MSESESNNGAIVSHAQNFEDIILWRALKHIKNGFYIDIGAQSPVVDSVSRLFYERGWRGINVEPNTKYASELRVDRPDEKIIEAAIGTTEGNIVFFDIPDTGLSTGDIEIAEEHQKQGFVVNRTVVQCLRLSDIFDEIISKEVHWLKIDVEGMESQVISSWSPSSVKPWIVIVESTEPNTDKQSFYSWEDILIGYGYDFVYFDGLNRFYVSKQKTELKEKFGPGPNVFDNFTLSGKSSAPFCQALLYQADVYQKETEGRVEQAAACQYEADIRAAQAVMRLNEAEARVLQAVARQHEAEARAVRAVGRQHEAEARAAQAVQLQHEADSRAEHAVSRQFEFEQELASIYNSRSWYITRPFRSSMLIIRWLRTGGRAWLTLKPGSRPRRIARRCLNGIAKQVWSRPRLKEFFAPLLPRLPWLDKILRHVLCISQASGIQPVPNSGQIPEPETSLVSKDLEIQSSSKRHEFARTALADTAAKFYVQLIHARSERSE